MMQIQQFFALKLGHFHMLYLLKFMGPRLISVIEQFSLYL